MDGLPELAVARIVQGLDDASKARLRATGTAGRDFVKRGDTVSVVGWQWNNGVYADQPSTIKVVDWPEPDGHGAQGPDPGWVLEGWRSSCVNLEWTNTKKAFDHRVLVDDPRVKRQAVVANWVALPDRVPTSLKEVRCNWLHIGEGLSPMPQLESLSLQIQMPVESFSRFTGLLHLDVEYFTLFHLPAEVGTVTQALFCLKQLKTLRVKKILPGQLDFEEGDFPNLESLTIEAHHHSPPQHVFTGLGSLRNCSLLKTLSITGAVDRSLLLATQVTDLTVCEPPSRVPLDIAELAAMPGLESLTSVVLHTNYSSGTHFWIGNPETMVVTELNLVGGNLSRLDRILKSPSISTLRFEASPANLGYMSKVPLGEWSAVFEDREVCRSGTPHRMVRLSRACVRPAA